MKGMNMSCREAAKLVDKQSVKRLSFIEYLKLKFHNKICGLCAKYQKQSKRVDELIQERILKSESYKMDSLNVDSLKLKIKNQLKEL
jgi:hypothetical protein